MEENNQEVENIEEIPVVEGNDTIKIANENNKISVINRVRRFF